MEILQIWQVKIAILGGLITAILAVWNAFQGLKQRRIEHRWRQAEMAKKLWDNLISDTYAFNATFMLDGRIRTYKHLIELGLENTEVNITDIQHALSTPDNALTPKDLYIQDCFDALLHSWAKAEHFITIGLIEEQDLIVPAEYYSQRVKEPRIKNIFENFANKTGKKDALQFMARMGKYLK